MRCRPAAATPAPGLEEPTLDVRFGELSAVLGRQGVTIGWSTLLERDTVGCRLRAEGLEDARLPVDERPVAVERENPIGLGHASGPVRSAAASSPFTGWENRNP